MKESYDLRIKEEFACMLFSEDEGKRNSTIARKIVISSDDPRLEEIAKLHREGIRDHNNYNPVYYGWEIIRTYSSKELQEAEALSLKITSVFEPEGELQGTGYDPSAACPKCGAGAPQMTSLYLPLKRIPKSKDISRTIAGEIVVSLKIKELFKRHHIDGARLTPIRHSQRSSAESSEWFQLTVNNPLVEVAVPTLVGNSPFDEDERGEYRCPLGDTLGLNLLSELFINASCWEKMNIGATRQFFGARQGVLRPERKILISQRLYRLMEAEKIKGYKVEVAHLV